MPNTDTLLGSFAYYAGVDPGKKGAIGLMSSSGTALRVWPMPVKDDGEIDLNGLRTVYRSLSFLPSLCVGIEWPEAWPGAFNNVIRDAELFGRQKGYLEAFAFLHHLEFCRVSPVLWKGRLGLDGKTIEGANQRAAGLFDLYYPSYSTAIRGSRGGLRDGPLDALLIAHFLRMRGSDGMKSVVKTFGKDSLQAFVTVMGGGRRKNKFGKRRPA